MLHIVKGDLLESDCNVIAHQANCMSTMGAGIAKQISSKYPHAETMDKLFMADPKMRLGKCSSAYYEEIPLLIFNLYGQYMYGRGRHTDYAALQEAIGNMLNILQNMPIEIKHHMGKLKIGFPFGIGSGLAGGSWAKVKRILEYCSDEYNVDFYLYKLN